MDLNIVGNLANEVLRGIIRMYMRHKVDLVGRTSSRERNQVREGYREFIKMISIFKIGERDHEKLRIFATAIRESEWVKDVNSAKENILASNMSDGVLLGELIALTIGESNYDLLMDHLVGVSMYEHCIDNNMIEEEIKNILRGY